MEALGSVSTTTVLHARTDRRPIHLPVTVYKDAELTAEDKARLQISDTLISELEAADTIVLTAPMYNFSIPSTLKAWIDHVARRGRTFSYSAAGPQGLLSGKKVFVLTARGGIYSQGPSQAFDFQVPYLRGVFGFIGLTDVTFIHFEGTKISPESATHGFSQARTTIEGLLRPAAAA